MITDPCPAIAAAEKDFALRANRHSLGSETISGGWGSPGFWEKPKVNGKDVLDLQGYWIDLQDGTGLSVTSRAAHFRDGQIKFSGPRAPLALLDAVSGVDLLRIGVRAVQTDLPEIS